MNPSTGSVQFEQEYSMQSQKNIITCYTKVTYTVKLYNHTIPNKGSQVIDSPASNFEDLRYREIDTVSSYNLYKVKSLKAQRCTFYVT